MVSIGGEKMIELSDEELQNKLVEHNKWIKSLGNEGIRLNLDDIDLRKNNLKKCFFEQAYIIGCVFEQMFIQNQSFYLSKLYSSSLKNSDLRKVDFTKADLSYADISKAYLCNVNFSNSECIETNFNSSKFINIKLMGVLFDMVDLRDAEIYNADISYSCFEKVLVKGIVLKNIKGIENVYTLSINIESAENPQILHGRNAIEWLKNRII